MLRLKMYITLLVPIIAGIINFKFYKTSILKSLKVPINYNKKFTDNKNNR